MRRAASILRNKRDHFAALEILEAGKSWYEADANVTEAIDFLEFYSLEALSLTPPEQMNVPGEENLWAYIPLGAGGGDSTLELPVGDPCRHGLSDVG
jgi:1-pyrroline-5-carboxylate dehydrogenase